MLLTSRNSAYALRSPTGRVVSDRGLIAFSVGSTMFSPIYADSRTKQHLSFVFSLTVQCLMLAIVCHLPAAKLNQPTLHHPSVQQLQAQQLVMPIDFAKEILKTPPEPPTVAKLAKSPDVKGAIAAPPQAQSKPKLADPPAEAKAAEPKPVEAKSEQPQLDEPKPVERAEVKQPEAEPKPAEGPAAEQTSADAAGSGEGISPFPGWQMGGGNHGFYHHMIKSALPVFTPEPPILRGEFPEAARGKEVVLNVVINEQGSITFVQVIQGIGDGVEQQIVDTLKRWVYVPAKVNGKAIASQQQLRFHFPG
jgi:TonB family protein